MGGIGSIQYTGSSNRGCARLGGGAVIPPLGVVKEKVIFSAGFRGRWACGCIGHATAAPGLLVHRLGMILLNEGLSVNDT